ncbi:MAG: hypothetical protein FJ398_01355 [Verrucomicrobia bacterium]|nr:hypothetical protein [Verrucomicrobiota bacterium]
MRRIKTTLALLLVAFWAPVSVHCKLELVPGLEFLQCETETPAESDCDEDGCQVIESARYKTEENAVVVVPAFNQMAAPMAASFCEPAPLRLAKFRIPSTAPPELPRSWQFFERAALPPRAPSIVS